jgi:hypothetical protein
MRYVLLAMATLFVLGGSSAHAVPIPTYDVTDATMLMGPNAGAGDNIRFTFTGSGVDINGFGGMGCFSWCSGSPIPPGVDINLTQIFVGDYDRAVVGGVTYNPHTEFGASSPGFFNDSGGLNPIVMGQVGSGPTFSEFRMTMPTNGTWSLNFVPVTDVNGNATVRFVDGTFSASALAPTPEPGTLGLILVATAGMWIMSRRRSPRDAYSTGH